MSNFRFHRRVKIFPGLAVNLSKSGPSFTFGVRGAHVTVGHGRVTRTVGIPGSGMYFTSSQGHHSGVNPAHVDAAVARREYHRGPNIRAPAHDRRGKPPAAARSCA